MITKGADAVALVTGGGRGIGRGISVALAQAGFAVAVNYRSGLAAAEETCRACHAVGAPWAEPWPGDVARVEDHRRLVDGLVDRAGRIDVLVNNAGISSPIRGDMLEVSEESWDTVLGTNLKGPFFLSQRVARMMIAQPAKDSTPNAVIVNISSISAYVASVARSEYCISKAGMSMLTQLLAHRLAEHGILVYEVRPGIIQTDMTRPAMEKYDALIANGLTPIRRWGTPEDVGRVVALLARGQFSFSTGEIINVDGGFHSRHL
ncbi:MAG: 3-ketoacyl-ACP reductase [Planctomycetota bacterium]